MKTNFDDYLEGQLKDAAFAKRFKAAGDAWDVAVQIAALRNEAGLSQRDLARKVGTSQQQISRLESPGYEGHFLSMLRRVAEALGATISVSFARSVSTGNLSLNEPGAAYRAGRTGSAKQRPKN